jgi:hypothetical protein
MSLLANRLNENTYREDVELVCSPRAIPTGVSTLTSPASFLHRKWTIGNLQMLARATDPDDGWLGMGVAVASMEKAPKSAVRRKKQLTNITGRYGRA